MAAYRPHVMRSLVSYCYPAHNSAAPQDGAGPADAPPRGPAPRGTGAPGGSLLRRTERGDGCGATHTRTRSFRPV